LLRGTVAREQHVKRGLERFPAKWKPVRVKKTRQSKNESFGSDSIRTKMALGAMLEQRWPLRRPYFFATFGITRPAASTQVPSCMQAWRFEPQIPSILDAGWPVVLRQVL